MNTAMLKVALPSDTNHSPKKTAATSLTLPLLAIGVTLLAIIALVFWTGSPSPAPTADAERLPALAERDVFFEDVADGSVRVLDAKRGVQVALIAPASNGFLRGAVRGLVRERKRQSIGPEVPFTIAALATGRVVLRDAATTREIDLASFGSTNAYVFARLLPSAAEVAAAPPPPAFVNGAQP
jgi:putative photosynthetic complex assembly protein